MGRPAALDAVPVAVLADAFDRSDRSLADVARELGYMRVKHRRHTPQADTTPVRVLMGRSTYNAGRGYGQRRREVVNYEVALRFVRACGVDPVDVGL